jgi:peroxiredoxin Q/BCP
MPRRFPAPGDPAPDIELAGTGGPFSLLAHRGERVLLLFYPGDGTPICTRQFCAYRDDVDAFAALGAVAVGISPQDLDSHRRFIGAHRLTVPLLADVDGAVARAYGVQSRLLGTRRATFVVDEHGVVRYRRDHPLSVTYDGVAELRRALAALG